MTHWVWKLEIVFSLDNPQTFRRGGYLSGTDKKKIESS